MEGRRKRCYCRQKNLDSNVRKVFKFLVFLLFVINAFSFIFRLGDIQLGGDEVASYISMMPFLHAFFSGKILPSFLVFFHEPMFQIVQLPMMFFGATAFFVRLPNILSGIALFIMLYKVGLLIFKKPNLYTTIILLAIFTFGGDNLFLRTKVNMTLFNLILVSSLYFLVKFDQTKKRVDYYRAYQFFLLNIFVYIDVLFTFPAYISGLFGSKKVAVFSAFAFLAFVLWTAGVYAGSVVSGLYNWQSQAPFSLFARGTAYSLASIQSNIFLLTSSNVLPYNLFVLIGLIGSLFDKQSKLMWLMLIGPLIFFNVVKNPTVHLVNFISVLYILIVVGMRFLMEKVSIVKYTLPVILIFGIAGNILQMRFSNPLLADTSFKIAATFIRQHSSLCEKVYLNSSLDGFAFRFYFNRGYVTELNPHVNIAFVDGQSSFLSANSFGKSAKVQKTDGTTLSIYQRNYEGPVLDLRTVDNNLFTFSNTLNYVNGCFFK